MQKRDPEGRNFMVICLLFASVDILESIYQMYAEAGAQWTLKLTQFILKQVYDYNPAFILALSLAQFEHYRERSLATTAFLIKLVKWAGYNKAEDD
jgi:hypothetical protein